MTIGPTNYRAQFLSRLEQMILAAGGALPMFSSPTNYEDRSLQLLDVLALNLPNLGGRRLTRSQAPPATPLLGDSWDEITAGGTLLYGWSWWWNGSAWESPTQWAETAFNQIGALQSFYWQPQAEHNYLFKRLALNALPAVTQTAGNKWTLTMQRVTGGNAYTQVGGAIDTVGLAVAVWSQVPAVNLNVTLDLVATATYNFDLLLQPTGSAGVFQGTARVFYSLLRR